MEPNLSESKQKIIQFRKEIRKKYHDDYFNQIRMEIINSQANNSSHLKKDYEGQFRHEAIVDLLRKSHSGQQQIKFKVLNQYIINSSEALSAEFQIQMLKLCELKNNLHNNNFIACLLNTTFKSTLDLKVDEIINLNQILDNLYSIANDSQFQALQNSELIAYLLYLWLRKAENKESMKKVVHFYDFLSRDGLLKLSFLCVLSEASLYRELLPERDLIQKILMQPINYNKDHKNVPYKLCEIIGNFVRFDQNGNLHNLCLRWIQNRLKENCFPKELKSNLTALASSIFNSHQNQYQLFSLKNLHLGLIQEIIYRAKLGAVESKQNALRCLTILCRRADEQFLIVLAIEKDVLTTLAASLAIPFESNLIYQILSSICRILEVNPKVQTILEKCGFRRLLEQILQTNDVCNKIITISIHILENYNSLNHI